MMAKGDFLRVLGVPVAVVLALAGALGGLVPAMAHYNNCTIGNSKQVVIVFKHANQGGALDDLCWKDDYSYEDEFSVNEEGIDDVGENANFHDIVSSLNLKNDSSSNDLCVWLYIDAFLGGGRDEYWIGAGVGETHPNVYTNDAYDSMDLKRLAQGPCLP